MPLTYADSEKQFEVTVKTPIDLDRGVMLCRSNDSQMDIYMYLDDPGRYYNAAGKEVGEHLAEIAGFQTDRFRKERLIREKMKATEEAIRSQIEAEVYGERVFVKEVGDYRLVQVGSLGYHRIEDKDGIVLTKKLLTLAEADKLLAALVPDEYLPEGVSRASEE